MNRMIHRKHDNDLHKGAIEEDPQDHSMVSQKGQLSHRNPDPLIKAADSDFPEPGENPEHSGEPEELPRDPDSEPGQR
jgi:hypothetical protein